MYASEEHESATRAFPRREFGEIDAVVDGREVGQVGVSVGLADRNISDPAGITAVDRFDPVRREPVDRREDRRTHETGVREWQKVVVVVDQVEVDGLLEDVRDVKRLPHFGIERGIFFERPGTDGIEVRLRDAVGGREERHIHATFDQSLGQEGHDALPGAVVARRHAPRNSREHRDAHGVASPGMRTRRHEQYRRKSGASCPLIAATLRGATPSQRLMENRGLSHPARRRCFVGRWRPRRP